jgi:hypothetical protein
MSALNNGMRLRFLVGLLEWFVDVVAFSAIPHDLSHENAAVPGSKTTSVLS